MTLRDQLILVFETYCRATDRSESRISTQVLSGGKRLQQIRDGGDIGTVGFEKAMQWLSNQWPDDLPWPEGIPRPSNSMLQEAAE
ncbi:hypothetical protein DXM21_20040 [Agrobacterium rosae]|nr:hypothetical protein DXM21_20040 [Agrobacterium rosae]KAA3514933.1 hypothetical protein DXM25_20330 [Agrobacterium rosae]MQB50743.1 hypothetical protein [Agrobacterium rosae]